MPRRSNYFTIPKEVALERFHQEYLKHAKGMEDMLNDMKHCDLYYCKDSNETFVYGLTKIGPIMFTEFDSIVDFTLERSNMGMMPKGQHLRELELIDMNFDLGIVSDVTLDRHVSIDLLSYDRHEMKYVKIIQNNYWDWMQEKGYNGANSNPRDWKDFYHRIYYPNLVKFTSETGYIYNEDDWVFGTDSEEEEEEEEESYYGEVMFPIVSGHYTGYLHNAAILFRNGWRPHIKNDTMKFDWTYVAITYRTIKTIVGGMISFGGAIPGLGIPISIGQMVFSFTFWLYPMKPNLSFSNEFSKNLRTPSDDLREVMEKLIDTKAAGIYYNDKFKIKRGWGLFEGYTLRLEGDNREIVLNEWDPRRKKNHKIKYKYSHPIPLNIIENYYEGLLEDSRIDRLAKIILPEMIGGIQHYRNIDRRAEATELLQLYE